MDQQPAIDVEKVAAHLREFAAERDWEQFHTPKNLAMALAGEAAEVLELFQWLTPEQSRELSDSPSRRRQIGDELADVLQYVIRMADVLGIDLDAALWAKLEDNAVRYPADEARGHARKYTDLDGASSE